MSGHFFQRGTFDAVIVGADRIAANGDTANKIGTYMLAVLAQKHGVPFYVAAPISTIDLATPGRIVDPDRRAVGRRGGGDRRARRPRRVDAGPVSRRTDVAARHPAFDVTPAEMITAIITERGIVREPYGESLRKICGR